MWETNGTVRAIAIDGDYSYLAGSFDYVGPSNGSGVKLTTTSASPDMGFPQVDGEIHTSVSDGAGGLYIGGTFTTLGGVSRIIQ